MSWIIIRRPAGNPVGMNETETEACTSSQAAEEALVLYARAFTNFHFRIQPPPLGESATLSEADRQFWLSKVVMLRGFIGSASSPPFSAVAVPLRHLADLAEAIEHRILGVTQPVQAITSTAANVSALPGQIEWRPDIVRDEISLIYNNVRAGGVARCTDNKTKEVMWWTAEIATAEGDRDVPGFFDTGDKAKAALVEAIAATLVNGAKVEVPDKNAGWLGMGTAPKDGTEVEIRDPRKPDVIVLATYTQRYKVSVWRDRSGHPINVSKAEWRMPAACGPSGA